MTRRSRRRSPARCGTCRAPIRWLRLHGTWRAFNPKPIDSRATSAGGAYPVEGRIAWRVNDLVEELMGRRACSHAEADEEVRDLAWFVLHACSPRSPDADTQESNQ